MRGAVARCALVVTILSVPGIAGAHHGADDGGFPWSLVGVLVLILIVAIVWVVSSRLEARRAQEADRAARTADEE